MTESFHSAINFLINTICDIFLFILIIRFILALVHANYFHPFTQFIVKLTNWLINPTKKLLPNIRYVEIASLFWIFFIDMLKLTVIYALFIAFPNLLGIFIYALGDVLKLFIQTFIFAIIFQVALAWLQPYSQAHQLLQQVVSPLLRPFQRIIPPIAGVDISPIPALIVLELLLILVAQPVMMMGANKVF